MIARRPRWRQEPGFRRRASTAAILLAVAIAAAPLGAQPGREPHQPLPRFADLAPPAIEGVVAVTLPPADPSGGLGGAFYFLEDPTGAASYEEVSRGAAAARFRLSTSDRVNLGFTRAVLWLRIDLEPDPVRRGGGWLLTLDYPLLDEIDVYDGASPIDRPILRLGDRLPFARRVVPHRTFGIPIPSSGLPRRLYLRVATESSMQVRPLLSPGEDLFLASTRAELFLGLTYGVMVLMAAYNLFLYFGVRDRSYLYFVVATAIGLLFLMSLYGHAFQYLWPTSPTLANLANPFFAALWIAFTALFARQFLEPAKHSRAAAVAIDGLVGLGFLAAAVALFSTYRPAMQLSSAAAALGAVTLMICGAVVWSRGHRAARFFALAWIGLGVGTLVLAASRFGLLPDNAFTHHGVLVGGVVEMLLLSLALSDKYRLMHLELERYSKGLESRVTERTLELEQANVELQRLSVTDPLTGVANRRRFDERFEEELGRHSRNGAPLSLAMVDIDEFKRFNDNHGHQRGDEALRRVAETIRSIACRATDVVARYGGEEFAVLLPETDEAAALGLADRICAAVRGLSLSATAGAEPARVTVSLGLATRIVSKDDGVERLMAAADEALYAAKRAGRNRVVVAAP